MSEEVNIDVNLFFKRIKKLYDHWENSEIWKSFDCNVFEVSLGQYKENSNEYKKSSILIRWLLGFEFTQTFFVFGKKSIIIGTRKKKANILKTLIENNTSSIKIQIIIKEDENDNFLEKFYGKLLENFEDKVEFYLTLRK
jgi:nucleosome binding factor SPN SPT16 subunit